MGERVGGRFTSGGDVPPCPFDGHRDSRVRSFGSRKRKDGTWVYRFSCVMGGQTHTFSECYDADPLPVFAPVKCPQGHRGVDGHSPLSCDGHCRREGQDIHHDEDAPCRRDLPRAGQPPLETQSVAVLPPGAAHHHTSLSCAASLRRVAVAASTQNGPLDCHKGQQLRDPSPAGAGEAYRQPSPTEFAEGVEVIREGRRSRE